MPVSSRTHVPSRRNAPTVVPRPMPRPDRGNGANQDVLRGQTPAPAGPACTTEGPTGDYVTMSASEKAGYLAELFRMPDVAATFAQRGFNENDQEQLAAVMQNEGGTNERRRMLGDRYERAASSLWRKLQTVGRDGTRLAGAESDPKLRLTEDERAVLVAAQQGRVDLAALAGDDADAKKAAEGNLLQAGIDHQVSLFDEYTGLDGRQRDGERLSREERARLTTLEGRTLASSGDFADARGISSQRFRAIYDEGQTRFEAARFGRSRDRVEAWLAGGERGEGRGVGVGGESAKDWVGRHPEARDGNHDALADAETSWGTAQIMGHYADRGDLNRADGTKFTMDDMRAAAARRSPNATDVDMQISYFRDIAGVPGHLGSASDIAVQYNGPDAPPSYAQGLRDNARRFERARDGLPDIDCDELSNLVDDTRRYA